MNQEFTQEQKDNLRTWAGERDAILISISKVKREYDDATLRNIKLAASSSEIQSRINASLTRLAELDKQEKTKVASISFELRDSLLEKTRLESEVTSLKKQVETLESHKNSLTEQIKTLTEVHKEVFSKLVLGNV